jgi:hypothetical protein
MGEGTLGMPMIGVEKSKSLFMGSSLLKVVLTCLMADKSLYAGIIYAGRIYNSATETNYVVWLHDCQYLNGAGVFQTVMAENIFLSALLVGNAFLMQGIRL